MAAACAPPPPPVALSVPVARAHPAALPATLPARIEVALEEGVGAVTQLELIVGNGARRVATALPTGVSLDGAQPVSSVRVHGPVRIGGTTHEGDMLLEAVPGTARFRAVVSLPLETYVAGVVAAEIPLWSAEPAELEALAIAARTYAVRATLLRGGVERLTDGVLDQAYRGAYVPPPSSDRGRAVRARLKEAIRRTRGLLLARDGLLEDVRYHAACGGYTASLTDVFANEPDLRPGSRAVRCGPCEARALREATERRPDATRPLGWVVELTPADRDRIAAAASLAAPLDSLRPSKRDAHGRWLEVEVVGSGGSKGRLDMNALRRAIGFSALPGSRIVALDPEPDALAETGVLRIQGRGRGHGVGLCQEALRDLARSGWSHERILTHYLTGARIVRIEEARR